MSSFIARQPMGRIAKAEEIAAMALYLASDEVGLRHRSGDDHRRRLDGILSALQPTP